MTAAHQFPTGAVASAQTRAGLVAWATEHDALVIEDNYDAEYRYDREPIGAIQGRWNAASGSTAWRLTGWGRRDPKVWSSGMAA
ncbi:hypothetical protein ACQPXH_15860 [Nocardia sp. CA-135953]|uniref:hypothetical protein n=1 Tax=Nocardia sp. CA-135953 TaxID=3239978 RepID=UPI003D9990C9